MSKFDYEFLSKTLELLSYLEQKVRKEKSSAHRLSGRLHAGAFLFALRDTAKLIREEMEVDPDIVVTDADDSYFKVDIRGGRYLLTANKKGLSIILAEVGDATVSYNGEIMLASELFKKLNK